MSDYDFDFRPFFAACVVLGCILGAGLLLAAMWIAHHVHIR